MVTCKELITIDSPATLDVQGMFVLPITWLYVMLKNDQLEIDEELFNKGNFTDEMLADLLLDFRCMSRRQFDKSSFNGVICIYNDWKRDKQWRGIRADKQFIELRVQYGLKVNILPSFSIDPIGMGLLGGPIMNFDDRRVAGWNIAYANVLQSFTKHVRFKGYRQCQKTLVLGR